MREVFEDVEETEAVEGTGYVDDLIAKLRVVLNVDFQGKGH